MSSNLISGLIQWVDLMGGIIIGRWAKAGGSRSLGVCLGGFIFCSWELVLVAMSWAALLYHTLPPWCSSSSLAHSLGACWPWAKLLKPWTQNKLSFLEVVLVRCLSRSDETLTTTVTKNPSSLLSPKVTFLGTSAPRCGCGASTVLTSEM